MRSEVEIQYEINCLDRALRFWNSEPDYNHHKGERIPALLHAKETLLWVLGARIGVEAIEARREESSGSPVRDLPEGDGYSRVDGPNGGE